MDQNSFNNIDPLLDDIADLVNTLLDSNALIEIKQKLSELAAIVAPEQIIEFGVNLELFDPSRGSPLPLLSTGLSVPHGSSAFRTSGDSTPQRYVVDGEIQVVPHDRCPKCWGSWDFKFHTLSCPACETTLGENCKVLLDSDVCPHCGEGQVTVTDLTCDQCGYYVDPTMATWG